MTGLEITLALGVLALQAQVLMLLLMLKRERRLREEQQRRSEAMGEIRSEAIWQTLSKLAGMISSVQRRA